MSHPDLTVRNTRESLGTRLGDLVSKGSLMHWWQSETLK